MQEREQSCVITPVSTAYQNEMEKQKAEKCAHILFSAEYLSPVSHFNRSAICFLLHTWVFSQVNQELNISEHYTQMEEDLH